MIQKLSIWIRQTIGLDGLTHMVISAILAGCLKHLIGVWAAMLIVLLIGIGKEIYDRRTDKGCAEFKDIACDLVGIMVGML